MNSDNDAAFNTAVDTILAITDRVLRETYINHARECGAADQWIKNMDNTPTPAVVMFVELIFGVPPAMKKIKETNEKSV